MRPQIRAEAERGAVKVSGRALHRRLTDKGVGVSIRFKEETNQETDTNLPRWLDRGPRVLIISRLSLSLEVLIKALPGILVTLHSASFWAVWGRGPRTQRVQSLLSLPAVWLSLLQLAGPCVAHVPAVEERKHRHVKLTGPDCATTA